MNLDLENQRFRDKNPYEKVPPTPPPEHIERPKLFDGLDGDRNSWSVPTQQTAEPIVNGINSDTSATVMVEIDFNGTPIPYNISATPA